MNESIAPNADLIVLSAGSLALFVVGILLLWMLPGRRAEATRRPERPCTERFT
jgi:hypothetical protein